MAYISVQDLDNIVGQAYKNTPIRKALKAETDRTKKYDIFLSHSRLDEKIVRQINYILEEQMGFDVYLDCVEDPTGENDVVTPATAAHLRDVMDRCSTLLYAVSVNAAGSKWMPWELGYSDATHGKVAILPISGVGATLAAYQNQEFIGLYPYVDRATQTGTSNYYLWVNDPADPTRYAKFRNWQETGHLTKHT